MPRNVYVYHSYASVPKYVQHVEIARAITEIESGAFDGCSHLRSITIPDSVKKIGRYAFSNCSGLQSVTLPDNITEIDEFAFYNCSGLQSVRIPDGVTEISPFAFAGCSGLQSVTIPDSVTEIGDSAFANCPALQSVTIPDNVTRIGKSAFDGCSGLQSVEFPYNITEIGNFAFSDCAALRFIAIPDGVTDIGIWAFADCSGLCSVTVPHGLPLIDNGVFSGCSGMRSVTIPDGVTKIGDNTFSYCSGLQSVILPDSILEIGDCAFTGCPDLRSLIYKGINIAPFINIDGYGVNTFDIIATLMINQIPLSENTVRHGIDMEHQHRRIEWIRDYPFFGTMHISPAMKSADRETEERLWQCFTAQKKTGCHVPKILDKLAIAAHICRIPPERLAETFDIRYTEALLRDGIPLVPAEACRCYYDRNICDALIRKDRISVMADVIALYNRSGRRECYKYLMDFIRSHPDTKIEDLQYAADHAEEIPVQAGTTPAQVRRHRAYMESLGEVTKIESEYGKTVPGFSLSDYPCNLAPDGITYDGMTARVLDLSDEKDIALAAMLGDLTNCCQRLEDAGETAMMHGFLNPDAGFWVIEDKDGKVRAQAEIWKTNDGNLVFDNIEFANTDRDHLSDRVEQLRGVIAAWAMENGYKNVIMGCGYNKMGIKSMEQAPVPELHLTPEEVFALQKNSGAAVSFEDVDEARRYMETGEYDPHDFVYTDADERCVYIKKDGKVSDYLMEGYDCALAEKHPASGHETAKERDDETVLK